MWVFCYGALMWNGWERGFSGERHDKAVLDGYHRSFNKSSTRNWGTSEHPCPTLGLEKKDGARCVGTAFSFPDDQRERIMVYLEKREGPSFSFPPHSVVLGDGANVNASVPINDRHRNTYMGELSITKRGNMARISSGTKGNCRSYVINVRNKLREMSIYDKHVEEFWIAIRLPWLISFRAFVGRIIGR